MTRILVILDFAQAKTYFLTNKAFDGANDEFLVIPFRLISSDALARGLDIPDIQLVVSYDVPKHIKGYIHRAGRTGRAGKPGTAVSVLTANQVGIFKQMLTGAYKVVPNIERVELNDTADTINYQSHVEKLKEILEKERNENLERTKATKRRRVVNTARQNENKRQNKEFDE